VIFPFFLTRNIGLKQDSDLNVLIHSESHRDLSLYKIKHFYFLMFYLAEVY